MRATDGRKLSHVALEAMRLRGGKAVESGDSPETAIRALGLLRPRIYEWLAAFREGGIEALRAKPIRVRPRNADEASVRSDYHSGPTWAPVGQNCTVNGRARASP